MNTATNYGRWRTLCRAFCSIGLTLSGSISAQTFFTETTAQIASPLMSARSTSFGDYDNDGDLDLYVPVGSFRAEEADLDMLLRNDRGALINVARQAGLTDSLSSDNAIWVDYDRDGHLDLYVGHRRSPPVENTLYRNNGDGTFAEVTHRGRIGRCVKRGFWFKRRHGGWRF